MSGVTEKRVSVQTLRFWLCAPAVVVTPLRSPTRCLCSQIGRNYRNMVNKGGLSPERTVSGQHLLDSNITAQ